MVQHTKSEPSSENGESGGVGEQTMLLASGEEASPAVVASMATVLVGSTLPVDTQIRKWESISEGLSTTYRLPKLISSETWPEWLRTFQLVVTLTDSDYLFSDVEVPSKVLQCQLHASRINWFRRYIFSSIAHLPIANIPTDPNATLVWLSSKYEPFAGIEAMKVWSDIADLSLDQSSKPATNLQTELEALKERAESAGLEVPAPIWKLIVLRAVQDSFPELTRDWLTTRWSVGLDRLLPELSAAEAAASVDKRRKKKRWHGGQPGVAKSINHVHQREPRPIQADSLQWALDSGAWVHISNTPTIFSRLRSCAYDLGAANGSSISVKGVGSVRLVCAYTRNVINLEDVHFCPDASSCLVSTRRLEKSGYKFDWGEEGSPVKILDRRGMHTASFARTEGDYIGTFKRLAISAVTRNPIDLKLLHLRFGHINAHALASLIKGEDPTSFFCETCVQAKARRNPGKGSISGITRASLELVHMDLAGGKMSLPEGIADGDEGLRTAIKYFLLITDDFTKFRWVRFAATKSEVPELIRDFLAYCYTQFGRYPVKIRSDGGREFDNARVLGYLSSVGSTWEPTAGYAPEQNGVSERGIQTVSSLSRAILLQTCIPHKHWPEILSTTVYLINRSPLSASSGKSPHERLLGDVPRTDHLRVIGCVAYAREPLALTKFQQRAKAMCLIGYDHSNIWRLLDLSTGRIVRRRDVITTGNGTCSTITEGDIYSRV